MRLLPENQVAVFEWLDRSSLDAVRFSTSTFNSLIAHHLSVYPLRLIRCVHLSRATSGGQTWYIFDLTADVTERTMKIRHEDPVEALRQVFQACESCAIQRLSLQYLDLTTGVTNVFTELLPTIPVNIVHLCPVRNGDGGTMDSLLPLFRGLSEGCLLLNPPEQATDATLRICREIGVSRVFVNAADLVSDCSAITDEGIFDFCFGADAGTSPGHLHELTVFRPRLTPQFLSRLIS
ncbi:hypothetical protein AAVH_29012, partial [Aphelenchoides avenae]